MWILLRVLAACVAFVWKYSAQVSNRQPTGERHGVPYFIALRKHKGKVSRIDIGVPLQGPVIFTLGREGGWDSFFKAVGIATEMQTGDVRFDGKVYVACDHPFLGSLLKSDLAARERILKLFDAGFKQIHSDGVRLWARASSLPDPPESYVETLLELRQEIRELESTMPSHWSDPFLRRAVVIEAFIWSILAYAIGSAAESAVFREDYHLSQGDVIRDGLAAAGLLFLALLLAIVVIMKGSSKGHRLIAESALVLCVGLPVATIQIVSDINRGFDSSPGMVTAVKIVDVEKREHRGRRGRRWYSYHFHVDSTGAPGTIPPSIEVSPQLFGEGAPGRELEITIGQGRLGHAWYRQQRVVTHHTQGTTPPQ